MKVYLDNTVLSQIVGAIDRINDETGEALEWLALSDHEFITSTVTKKEMEACPSQNIRGSLLFIYRVFGGEKYFNKETYCATGFSDALFGSVPFGGGEATNTVLILLQNTFEHTDARHIFQALNKHADYFLTLDENSILKKYRANVNGMKVFCNRGNLKLMNPIELVEDLK